MDTDHRRGYWIIGENIKKLKEKFLLIETQQGQFHFKNKDLEKERNLPLTFVQLIISCELRA